MKIFRAGFFGVSLRRSFWYAAIAAGAMASQSAGAAMNEESAYSEKFLVPAFVPDVRALLVNAARVRGWQLIDESPGELTFELQHAKSHMAVVVRSNYSKSEFAFRRVSAKTFQCAPQRPCHVDPSIVQRWMISLRREAGVALLRLAIKDAGGGLSPERAAVVETE